MPVQFLVWSELAVVWTLVAYGFGRSCVFVDGCKPFSRRDAWIVLRAFSASVAALLITQSFCICIVTGVTIFSHGELRCRARLSFAWPETIFLMVFLAVGVGIWWVQLQAAFDLTWLITEPHLAALSILLSSLIFVAWGGAHFVGTSLKTIVPRTQTVSSDVLKRGRIIGILERLILSLVVAFGSFSALAFLVGAKGLIRSKEFDGQEGRDFTEYFIAGTLLSVLLAIVTGLTIRSVFLHLWPDLIALKISGGD